MPNKKRHSFVVRRADIHANTEVDVIETTSLAHARREAAKTARLHRGTRVAIDQYDSDGYYVGEVESYFILPARA